MLFEVHDSIAALPGSTTARSLIASETLTYLNDMSQVASNDTELLQDLAEGFVRLGDVTGNPTNANLGQSSFCLLYTSPSPRDLSTSRMPSSA